MIEINFIPDQLRKRRRSDILSGGVFNIPREVMIGIGGGIVAFLLCLDVFVFVVKAVKFLENRYVKSKWEAVLPEKSTTDMIKSQLQEFQKEVKSMKDIMQGQNAIWSQKLNVISESLPKGTWLRRITLTDKQLFIEGTSVSKDQSEMASVGSFVSGMKRNEEFIKHFETIEVDNIQSRNTQSLEVSDFTILAKLK